MRPSGYAAIIGLFESDGKLIEEKGIGNWMLMGTPIEAEIMAAILGIESLRHPQKSVTLYSDSRYLIDAMTLKHPWDKAAPLLKELSRISAHFTVQWSWIAKNSQVDYHEKAHQLARKNSDFAKRKIGKLKFVAC